MVIVELVFVFIALERRRFSAVIEATWICRYLHLLNCQWCAFFFEKVYSAQLICEPEPKNPAGGICRKLRLYLNFFKGKTRCFMKRITKHFETLVILLFCIVLKLKEFIPIKEMLKILGTGKTPWKALCLLCVRHLKRAGLNVVFLCRLKKQKSCFNSDKDKASTSPPQLKVQAIKKSTKWLGLIQYNSYTVKRKFLCSVYFSQYCKSFAKLNSTNVLVINVVQSSLLIHFVKLKWRQFKERQ